MSLEDEIQCQADHTRNHRAQLLATDDWLRGAVKEFNGLVAEAARILRSRGVLGTPVAVRQQGGFFTEDRDRLTTLRVWVPTGLCAHTYAFTDDGLYSYSEYVFGGTGALKKRDGHSAGLTKFDRYVLLGTRVEDTKDYDQAPGSNKLGQYRASAYGSN